MVSLYTQWHPPPDPLHLGNQDVHVWRVVLDQTPHRIQSLRLTLSADEQNRAGRFVRARDRDSFVVSRAALRAILAGYLNRTSQSVNFIYGPRGKPALADISNTVGAIEFNMSHSESIALCAVARGREVGIDVEYLGRRVEVEHLARRFFSHGEVQEFLALPPDLRRLGFFLCWTRKEAYIKAKGEGLALPLTQFSVSLTPGQPATLLSTEWDPTEAIGWSIRELNPAPSYVAAVAARGRDWSLSCWEWSDLPG